ncbi:MarR family winged helix-turn-helix transcriptional regulator [Salipaludibacillus aurantiacus]|uniref:DNA-binding transcriptional regulator, MarR family n=1 Tax=Salipaludibacillus aurantiacus TaxID=1601833 RepID=A0A1H9Q7E9_9BACI|nr:MarR family transcriptional regulator [Salipaludibacillus aurantiacus]SER56348.1 DNA-binding transcriptional regulator, MarR family [Salipaludibacillus aurantiacus]
MKDLKNLVNNINEKWTDIYHSLHYIHQENISHQAVRLLQHIEKREALTVGDLADYIGVSHNTASEHIKRLIKKGLVSKKRSSEDERRVFVIMTPEGRGVLNKHTRLDEDKLENVLENLSDSEAETVAKAFHFLSREARKCSW